jgi:ABC-type antimicrobial peptide transport system permease subunit
MLQNYFKVALRNIKRHKGYSFINIFGLAVGMTCTLLILLWVQDELSYNRFHKNADDIYRVIKIWRKGETAHYATTPAPLAPALKEEFPEIINSARYTIGFRMVVAFGETAFYEDGGGFGDPSLFDLFDFPFLEGDPKTALSDPTSIVLSEEMAARYFGEKNPLGKILRINDQFDFSVTGIMRNIPSNSHIQFDFLLPFMRVGEIIGRGQETFMDWHNTAYYTYVLLQKETSYRDVSEKISNFLKKPIPESTSSLYLQPLKKIHLHSSHLRADVATGDITTVVIFSAMALFILVIACINFMNLTTARSGNRAKEVGLRKVVGANKTNLTRQFFGESILLSFIALLFAVVLVSLFLSAFNSLSGKDLTISLSGNIHVIFGLISISLFTGVVSGIYPALFLSSFQPVRVLKDSFKSGSRGSQFRKVLVVFQFSLTIILIIGMIVVFNQLEFIRNRKLGFDKEHLIYIPMNENLRPKYVSFKGELLQNSDIFDVTATSSLPFWGTDTATQDVSWEGKNPDEAFLMRGVGVDHDYMKTFKIEMSEGRRFSKEYSTDDSNYILNETAVNAMRMESPIGKKLTYMGNTGTIIGIIKDYHFKPLVFTIEPLLLRLYESRWLNFVYMRVKSEHIPQVIQFVEDKWKQFVPSYPFEYFFVDTVLDGLYTSAQRTGTLFRYFTILALSISCLGLFGLASFVAEQRTKEIGIRKVLGASVSEIVILLSKEFMKWVVIANVFAWPIGYFVMSRLLQTFAYRIKIGVNIVSFQLNSDHS